MQIEHSGSGASSRLLRSFKARACAESSHSNAHMLKSPQFYRLVKLARKQKLRRAAGAGGKRPEVNYHRLRIANAYVPGAGPGISLVCKDLKAGIFANDTPLYI